MTDSSSAYQLFELAVQVLQVPTNVMVDYYYDIYLKTSMRSGFKKGKL